MAPVSVRVAATGEYFIVFVQVALRLSYQC